MAFGAGELVTYYPDLEPANAVAGRRVRVGATLLCSRPVSPQDAAAANNRLAVLLEDPRPGPDAAQVRDQGDGRVFVETSMEGRLLATWDLAQLRLTVGSLSQTGLVGAGIPAHVVDTPAVLDLGGVSREVIVNPTYYDPTGEVDPDGTVNWSHVLSEGTKEGLGNFGEGAGTVLRAAGSGVGTAVGGIFGGLGVVGTIVAILLVLVALVVIYFLTVGRVIG